MGDLEKKILEMRAAGISNIKISRELCCSTRYIRNINKKKGGDKVGHLIFCVLHFICILFGFVGLIITIPLHIIYAAVSNKPAAS